MRFAGASLVLTTTLILQVPSRAAGPRIPPVAEPQRTSEQQSIAARFASTDMPNAVATYLNHPALADHILPYEHYVWNDSTLPSRHRSSSSAAPRAGSRCLSRSATPAAARTASGTASAHHPPSSTTPGRPRRPPAAWAPAG